MSKPIMDVIYKYPLIEQMTYLEIPFPAKFLSIGKDANGVTCVWFITSKEENVSTCGYWFYKYGTGWPIDRDLWEKAKFIGTIVEEPYVWHVFMEEGNIYENFKEKLKDEHCENKIKCNKQLIKEID